MEEIPPEAWVNWKNQPVTKRFFKYITDYRNETGKWFGDDVSNGVMPPAEETEIAVQRCQVYNDIADLTQDEINEFYKEDDDGDS